MKESQSEFLEVRGLKYHCRTWGERKSPLLVMLHGFQDVSASWQFTVDALRRDWFVVAPDWRGYGLTQWSGSDSYWFGDYLGDLEFLLEHYSPQRPVRIVAHSMGAHVTATYAGVRPDRVSHFVNVDGFGPPVARQDPPPRRFTKWLAQLHHDTSQRPYLDFDEFALRMQSENPRLTDERARFLVQHWGVALEDGSVARRADPAHKRNSLMPLPADDAIACWQQTEAQVLWIDGEESGLMARLSSMPDEFERRSRAYRGLRIEHIAQAGHNIHHDQPERLAEAIEKFLP